jgi:TonB family protein
MERFQQKVVQFGALVCFALVVCNPIAGKNDICAAISRENSESQGSSEWQRYRVENENFSVLLPVVPAMTTASVYLDQQTNRRERIIGAYADGVVYAIHTFESKSLSLDQLIQRFASGQQIESMTVDGLVGKLSRFENADRLGITAFFKTGGNLYVFRAFGARLANPEAGISKFSSSISFGKPIEGRQIVDGAGEQPTAQGNPLDHVFTGKEVTRKATVITKPEPRYTERARVEQITGTVTLRAVFSSTGAVTNIHAVSELPDGLTERAIGAAQQIRFIPAVKDGRFVSMWIELQYNFNLY